MGNVKGSKSADDARRLLISYEPASGGPATSAVARDAALGGLFIETASPLAIGTLLSVEMKSPRSDAVSVTLEARVFSVRTSEESKADPRKQPAGMAVRFLDLPTSAISTLQSILDHHRPPARTQLGVGDEKEALWAAAGGRDDEQARTSTTSAREEDAADALALAASVVVDGRPTFDPLPPSPAPGDEAREHAEEPRPPRHPTPRMVPISPVSARVADPASAPSLPYPAPSTRGGYVPPPSHGLATKRNTTTGVLVATVVAFVVLAVVVVLIASRI